MTRWKMAATQGFLWQLRLLHDGQEWLFGAPWHSLVTKSEKCWNGWSSDGND